MSTLEQRPLKISPEARKFLEEMHAAFEALRSFEASGVTVNEATFAKGLKLPKGPEIPPGATQTKSTAFTCGFLAPNRYWVEADETIWDGVGGRRVMRGRGITGCNGKYLYRYAEPSNSYDVLPWQAPAGRFGADDRDRNRGPAPIPSSLVGDPLISLAAYEWDAETIAVGPAEVTRATDVIIDDASYVAIQITQQRGDPVTLLVDPTTHFLRRFVQPVGTAHKTTIDYLSIKIGVTGDDPRFNWSPPRDAKRQ